MRNIILSLTAFLLVQVIHGEELPAYDCTGNVTGVCRSPDTCLDDFFAVCPIPGSPCCPDSIDNDDDDADDDLDEDTDDEMNEDFEDAENDLMTRGKPCQLLPKCESLGGYCVSKKKLCYGKIVKKGCKGPKCFCCVPEICPLTGLPGTECTAPKSCSGYGSGLSGVYEICLHRNCPPVNVKCMGDGWTVILYRNFGFWDRCDFAQDWTGYKQGFCDPSGEYWLGNDILHALTKENSFKMQLYGVTSSGDSRTMSYDSFSVADESDGYRLSVSGYDPSTSSAPDQFEAHPNTNVIYNGQKFTTYDVDNDNVGGFNCVYFSEDGGWWFKSCAGLILTSSSFMHWYYWDDYTYGPIEVYEVVMKIKPQ